MEDVPFSVTKIELAVEMGYEIADFVPRFLLSYQRLRKVQHSKWQANCTPIRR